MEKYVLSCDMDRDNPSRHLSSNVNLKESINKRKYLNIICATVSVLSLAVASTSYALADDIDNDINQALNNPDALSNAANTASLQPSSAEQMAEKELVVSAGQGAVVVKEGASEAVSDANEIISEIKSEKNPSADDLKLLKSVEDAKGVAAAQESAAATEQSTAQADITTLSSGNTSVPAETHNEAGVDRALTQAEYVGLDTAFLDAMSNLTEDAQMKRAYNALSGEINASAKTAMVNDSFYVQEAVIDRLDCAGDLVRSRAQDGKQKTSGYCDVNPNHPVSVWGTVYGQQGSQSGRSGVANMGQSTVGWIMGADAHFKGGWRAGGLLAYGRDSFNVQSGRGSSAHANVATIGAYVGNAWRVGGLTKNAAITFKGGMSYSWNMLHTNRRVDFDGYNGHLASNNRSGTGQVFAETGYRMAFNTAGGVPLEVEPFARMTYLNYGQDSFSEHGADAALHVKGRDSSIGFSTMGVKLATSVNIGKLIFSPHVEAAYRRAFGRTNATIHENFSALGSGYGMAVQGTPLSVSTAQINTGFAAKLSNHIDVNIDYIGQYGNRQTSSGGYGSFRFKF